MRTKAPLVDRKILIERQQDCGNNAVRQVIRVTWHDHLLIAGLIAAAKETAVCTFIGQIIPRPSVPAISARCERKPPSSIERSSLKGNRTAGITPFGR